MGKHLILTAAALLLGAGCPSPGGPSDAAITAYADARKGASEGGSAAAEAPKPAKRVRVTVVAGHGLPDVDSGPGETDAYVVLEYEGVRYKSSVVEGSLEPVWGDSFVLEVRKGGVLVTTLMDEETFSDEKMGVVSVPLPPVLPGASEELELKFREGAQGTVVLRVEGLEGPPA